MRSAMKRTYAEWPLRLGCGLVNLYASYFLLTDPARYHKYVPAWLANATNGVASIDAYLQLQGLGELTIAILLISWLFPRWCVRAGATLHALQMTLILAFIGVNSETFRNVGLLGAALSLMVMTCIRSET